MTLRRGVALELVFVLLGSGLAGWASAQGAASDAGQGGDLSCGRDLSVPVRNKWRMIGGIAGPGCPQAPEMATPRSPQGSDGREVKFPASAILWHASGPRAGQTYSVSGCIYRLSFQYGGPGGWLGLPTSDLINTPDGQRQAFEGGRITFRRVDQACEAERTENDSGAALAEKAPLEQFYDAARGDYVAAASAPSIDRALAAHYQRLRTEGYVFTESAPGLIPLKVFWNESRGLHEEVATPEYEREALAIGYEFDGAQGYIYADPHPGTRPVKHFSDPTHIHGLVTATAEGEADAVARGFSFDRIEGYIADGP